MADTETSQQPRVSEHFPRVPKGCEKAAESFFSCFYEHGKQPAGESDADVGNRALAVCEASLRAYNACADEHMRENRKPLFRVPEAYRMREN